MHLTVTKPTSSTKVVVDQHIARRSPTAQMDQLPSVIASALANQMRRDLAEVKIVFMPELLANFNSLFQKS